MLALLRQTTGVDRRCFSVWYHGAAVAPFSYGFQYSYIFGEENRSLPSGPEEGKKSTKPCQNAAGLKPQTLNILGNRDQPNPIVQDCTIWRRQPPRKWRAMTQRVSPGLSKMRDSRVHAHLSPCRSHPSGFVPGNDRASGGPAPWVLGPAAPAYRIPTWRAHGEGRVDEAWSCCWTAAESR